MAQHFAAALFQRTIHCAQKVKTGWRNLPADDTAIVLSARTLNKASIFQAIQQTRDVGIMRDHAFADLAARQAFRPSATQDAQRIVLRAGESEFFQPRLDLRLERIGGAQQGEIGFLFSTAEWNVLLEFRLQTTHIRNLVVMTSMCQTLNFARL